MSQIAEKKFSIAMLLGGLSVNLNHLIKKDYFNISEIDYDLHTYHTQTYFRVISLNLALKLIISTWKLVK